MVGMKAKHGGPRKGSGRKPAPDQAAVRRNRVTFTLSDADLATLRALADARGLPTGTLAFHFISRAMRRTK